MWSTEFHCDLQLRDCSRNVNGIASGAAGWVVDGILLWFATVGCFPHSKWHCKWCCSGGVADGVLEEVSHEMRFWEIADARKPMFFHAKSVPEPRWSTSAVRRVRDGLVCGRIMFGYVRIMLGSCSDRFRNVNGVSSVFRAYVVDRIPLWFATAGLFPQCKWDCKWCCRMSCRWNSSVIRNCRMLPAM